MADYISREAALKVLQKVGTENFKFSPEYEAMLVALVDAEARIKTIPPADVIPRATIEAGIEEAIARLNAIRGQAINGDGQLDYPAYLELHDAITGILPEKEADSDG